MTALLALSRVRKSTIVYWVTAIILAVVGEFTLHRHPISLIILYVAFAVFVVWVLFQGIYEKRRMQRHPVSRLQDFEVRRLARLHADVRVTMPDSIASGNCFGGSLRFTRKYFPTRPSVSLGELLGVASKDGRVMRVIKYKLTKIRGLRLEEARAADKSTEGSSNSES